MKKRLISFTLVIHILVVSIFVFALTPPKKTEAVGTGLAITGFVLSVIGALDMVSNGGVRRVSGQAYDAVNETISGLMGTGIYEDSNGDYVFSGQATKDIYDALLGSQPTRVLSDFGNASSFMGGLTYYNTAYMSADAINTLNSWRTLYTDYLISCYRGYWYSSNNQDRIFVIYDLSDVAFLNLGWTDSYKNYFTFYNNAGSVVNVNYKAFVTDASSMSSIQSGTTDRMTITRNYARWDTTPYCRTDLTYYLQDNDVGSISGFATYSYNNMPFKNNGSLGGTVVWSNKSLILSQSTGAGLGTATQQSGIMVANTFNQIPSISKTVIENNDWDYIYNSYVNNVNSESNNYWDGTTFDTEKLLDYMQSFSNSINDAVASGADNIEQAILTTNEWLQRIYQRLSILQNILDNMGDYGSGGGSGGSGCSWSAEDIGSLLDMIDRIDSNLSLSLEDMQDIYTILGSILDAIEDGATPSTPNYTLPGIDVPFDEISNLPSSDVLDAITNTQILVGLLEDTFLFGSVFLISGALEMLSAQPVAPSFSIPVKMESLMQVDETIDIDFADFGNSFDFIREIVGDLLCLLFILMLIKLTNELLSFVVDLVS